MKFQHALGLFSIAAGFGPLTARQFSEACKTRIGLVGSVQRQDRELSVKRISGDLDRLYRMGFLNRKRVKRILSMKDQRQRARGFEYEYKMSKQGWQYLQYLARPTEVDQDKFLDFFQTLTEVTIDKDLKKHLSPAEAQELIECFRVKPFEDRGRHNRYPSTTRRNILTAFAYCISELVEKDKEIKRLQTIVAWMTPRLRYYY